MNSCSHNAIVMEEDAEGFIFPHINGNKCVECGLCMRVCPVLNTPIITNVTKPNVFAVWSLKDRTVSSSGGAFSAFARNVLEADGVVFGATLGTNLLCYHREIHMIEELEVLRGSKYVQSELRDTFFKVKAYLKEGKNKVDVRVIGSHKNLLGPHYRHPAPGLASPWHWKNIDKQIPGSEYQMMDYGLMTDFDLVH